MEEEIISYLRGRGRTDVDISDIEDIFYENDSFSIKEFWEVIVDLDDRNVIERWHDPYSDTDWCRLNISYSMCKDIASLLDEVISRLESLESRMESLVSRLESLDSC